MQRKEAQLQTQVHQLGHECQEAVTKSSTLAEQLAESKVSHAKDVSDHESSKALAVERAIREVQVEMEEQFNIQVNRRSAIMMATDSREQVTALSNEIDLKASLLAEIQRSNNDLQATVDVQVLASSPT